MSHERVTKVEIEDLPPGYEVTHHESRGYDSPDRWYEATFRGKRIGHSKTLGYGSADEAAAAARSDAARRDVGEVQTQARCAEHANSGGPCPFCRIAELERRVEEMQLDHEAMELLRGLKGDFELHRQDTGNLSPPPQCRWTATKIRNRDWPDGEPVFATDPAWAVVELLRGS